MRKIHLKYALLSVLQWTLLQVVAYGAEVVDIQGAWKINWSKGRMEYVGNVVPNSEGKEGYRELESKVWKSARDSAVQLIPSIRQQYEGSDEMSRKWSQLAVGKVQKSIVSKNTAYLADGSVSVKFMANPGDFFYAEGLGAVDLPERLSESCSGVIFRLADAQKPVPYYRVIGPGGQVLLSLSDVKRAAYEKNLMGKWFKAPTLAELKSVSDGNIKEFPVVAVDRSTFRVSVEADTKDLKGCAGAIASSRIALAIP